MTDERQGYPSASSAQRYALCPGSFLLEKQCPPEPESEDAASGSRIHAALEGKDVELNEDECRVYVLCREQEYQIAKRPVDSVFRERRFWYRSENSTWSGKADAVFVTGKEAVVVDYKTGRGEVESAAANLQLRALAVLVAREFDVSAINVAIIQPLAGQPSVALYTPEDLMYAIGEIDDLMARVQQPGQPRNPSEAACKYCRAKSICPEARSVAGQAVALSQPMAIELMTRQEVADFLDMAPVAEKVIEAVRAKAKQMLESGDELPGWTLKDGPARATITDPQTVFQRFIEAGGTDAQFMRAVKVGKGDLKTALKESTGQAGKALDTALANLLDGCTETKPTAKQLTRIKQ